MLRPPAALVQWARSGQSVQAAANVAVPSPSRPRRMPAVFPAGQVTVSSSRLTVNWSLVNISPGSGRPLGLAAGVDPGFGEPVQELPAAVGGVAVDGPRLRPGVRLRLGLRHVV